MTGIRVGSAWTILLVLLLAASPQSIRAESPTGAPEDWPSHTHGAALQSLLFVEQLEWRAQEGPDLLRWEALGWLGGDTWKGWLETEGEQVTSGPSEAEIEALVGRMVLPYWDVRVGVRQDFLYGSGPDHARTFASLGLKGLAPLWFDTKAALYVSGAGDVSARVEGTYDLLVTQQLVLQPGLELNAAAQAVRKFGVGSGINDVELGLRLRYEILREVAPYLGMSWTRQLGDTADLARSEGEQIDTIGFVAGLRLWW